MADDPNLATLPTQLSPQVLATLSGGGGTPPLGQTSPIGPTSPIDPQQVAAQMMQRGEQLTEQQLNIANPAAAKATAISEEPYKTNDPVYGTWSGRAPGSGTPTPQPGFLHTLGRALLAIGEATVPGQTILKQRYASQSTARGSEETERADRIQALQKQAQLAEEPVGATSKMGPAYMSAAAREQSAQASTDRVKAYSQSIADRAKNFAATQDWHAATLDEKKRANLVNEAQKAADETGRDYREKNRDATLEEVAGIVTGTRKEIANEAAAREPSVKSWLFNKLGIDVPQTSAPSPEFRQTPKATSPVASAPARPKGVPSNAVWNPKVQRWQAPKQ